MRALEDISIKRKFTAIIMISSTIALLLVSPGFVYYEIFNLQRTMVEDISTLAQFIGDRSTAALAFGNQKDAEQELQALSYRKHIKAAALYDKDGNLFALYPSRTVNNVPHHPESTTHVPNVQRFEPGQLIVFHQIKMKVDGSIAGTIFLSSDLQELHRQSVRYACVFVLIMGASLLATLFLSSILQRVITEPISRLAESARVITTKKNYSVRVAERGRDELGQLMGCFNEMLEQIQRRDTQLQEANDRLELRVQERTRKLNDEITEHRRAGEALQQQFYRTSLLNQITRAISDRQDTDNILNVVLHELESHFDIDLGMAALFDSKSRTLNIAASSAKDSGLAAKLNLPKGHVLPLPESDFLLYEKGRAFYIAETSNWNTTLGERLAALSWRSAAIVPMIVEEKLFGVLVAARFRADGYSSGDADFFRMLSEHVSLAAHQARLYADLEKAYNALRQAQAAILQQERLKALGQMASGIAHDINNALSPVVGFPEFLLKGNYGLKQEVIKYLGHIRMAGEEITHVVDRLREFYRPREMDEPLQHLSLNPLVEQVVDMTRPRWRDIPQSNGITIEVQALLLPDLPRLAGIESEIREAITNLLLNAVDALPGGGKITVRTGIIRDNYNPPKVTVGISDTGVGMDEETCKRCLDPFFSTKGKCGAGLGLAMVYGIMERHKGNIEIESAAGKGTVVRLIFPIYSHLPMPKPYLVPFPPGDPISIFGAKN